MINFESYFLIYYQSREFMRPSTPSGVICCVIRSGNDQNIFLSKFFSDGQVGSVWWANDLYIYVPDQLFDQFNRYWSSRIKLEVV